MIVVDTNVVYAGLVSSRGWSFRLLEKMLFGKEPYLMNTTLAMEYRAVLMDPEHLQRIPLTKTEVEDVFAKLVQTAVFQNVYYLWRPNLRDEKDNFLMELAVAGQARAIVTFNKKDFERAELKWDIPILTPKEYLKETVNDSI